MVYPRSARHAITRSFELFNLVSFTIGTKAANTINVAGQLKDAKGRVLARAAHLRVHLSDAITGATLTATVTTSALAVQTRGVILNIPVTGKVVDLITDTQGRFDLNVIQTATPVAYYLAVHMPDGSLVVSSVIQF